MPARRLVASAYSPRRLSRSAAGRLAGLEHAALRWRRLAAVKDLGFTSAYVFGAVCPGEGKAAAIIMPICNTIAMD